MAGGLRFIAGSLVHFVAEPDLRGLEPLALLGIRCDGMNRRLVAINLGSDAEVEKTVD
jgi:hypothetical protein